MEDYYVFRERVLVVRVVPLLLEDISSFVSTSWSFLPVDSRTSCGLCESTTLSNSLPRDEAAVCSGESCLGSLGY